MTSIILSQMSGEATLTFRVTISFLSLVILLMFTPSQLIFAQSSAQQFIDKHRNDLEDEP